MNVKIRAVFVLLAVVVVGIAVWFFFGDFLFGRKIRNVLLISIDTCRADHLSCYGYQRKTTPNIDTIAGESILFENVVTPVPITLPAHSSMLTGTIPPYHGVHDNLDYQLAKSNVTLPEMLKEHGFTTGAIISAFVLDAQFGLNQGFDSYDDKFDEELNSIGIVERRGAEASHHANQWLEKHAKDNFFLFLHYYDPHVLYDPPEPFKSAYADTTYEGADTYSGIDPETVHNRNLYAGEIAYTDYCIGQVIEKLKELNLYDSTMIIITGDHGESLREHGEGSHGYFIYQSTLRVPLIFKIPGRVKGIRVADNVGLVDIVPTVCTMLKIPVPNHIQGRDLSRYFSRRGYSLEENISYYCESLWATKYGCNPLVGLVSDPWKYIQTTRPELYNLAKDPSELFNLVNEQHQRARILQDNLKQILEEQVRTGGSDSKLALDQESIARLESLGYVGGGVIDESFEFDQSKEDPKDLIDFHILFCAANCRMAMKKYSEAKEVCQKMLEMRPNFARTYYFLGTISWYEGDNEKAFYYYSKCLELNPDDYKVYSTLGLVFSSERKFDEAVKYFQEALRLNPDARGAHTGLAVVYANQRKLDDAIKHWNEALRLGDTDPNTHINLADALVYLGQVEPAITHWEESLKLEPDNAKVHADLASTLLRKGKVDQAISHWEESLKLVPDNAKVHADLGNALLRKGKVDQAIFHWEEVLRLDPNQPLVENNLAEALCVKGKLDEAIRHWRHALKFYPDWPVVLNNLAWVMATHESEEFYNPSEALQYARKACELTEFKHPDLLDTLSAAYAAVGEFNKAVDMAEKALKLYEDSGLEKKANDLKERIELFRKGQPYQEKP